MRGEESRKQKAESRKQKAESSYTYPPINLSTHKPIHPITNKPKILNTKHKK